jgi:transcriptional regulator with XRE-family HTH domain
MARKAAEVRVRLNAQATWGHMARQNLSQNALARRLRITSGYLSQLVNGQRFPSPKLRRRILEILPGASSEELFVLERRSTVTKNAASPMPDEHDMEVSNR